MNVLTKVFGTILISSVVTLINSCNLDTHKHVAHDELEMQSKAPLSSEEIISESLLMSPKYQEEFDYLKTSLTDGKMPNELIIPALYLMRAYSEFDSCTHKLQFKQAISIRDTYQKRKQIFHKTLSKLLTDESMSDKTLAFLLKSPYQVNSVVIKSLFEAYIMYGKKHKLDEKRTVANIIFEIFDVMGIKVNSISTKQPEVDKLHHFYELNKDKVERHLIELNKYKKTLDDRPLSLIADFVFDEETFSLKPSKMKQRVVICQTGRVDFKQYMHHYKVHFGIDSPILVFHEGLYVKIINRIIIKYKLLLAQKLYNPKAHIELTTDKRLFLCCLKRLLIACRLQPKKKETFTHLVDAITRVQQSLYEGAFIKLSSDQAFLIHAGFDNLVNYFLINNRDMLLNNEILFGIAKIHSKFGIISLNSWSPQVYLLPFLYNLNIKKGSNEYNNLRSKIIVGGTIPLQKIIKEKSSTLMIDHSSPITTENSDSDF